jgi:signal peptidase I
MRWRRVITVSIALGAVATVALRGRLRRFAVVDASMAPTLSEGDWVIARRRNGPLERGDIVILPDPADRGRKLVKRVIGLPGERLGVTRGRVTVGDALLADRWATGSTRPDGEWVVPASSVWVLSDNRGATWYDGRTFGPTPTSDIEWVVVARYHPSARAGFVA